MLIDTPENIRRDEVIFFCTFFLFFTVIVLTFIFATTEEERQANKIDDKQCQDTEKVLKDIKEI